MQLAALLALAGCWTDAPPVAKAPGPTPQPRPSLAECRVLPANLNDRLLPELLAEM